MLGAVGISNFDWADLKGEIGYWVARGGAPARDRRRARRGCSPSGRSTRSASSALELLAHPENEASQRLAERAGFTREGMLRRYRRRHGVREDLVMFSLLAEDLEP